MKKCPKCGQDAFPAWHKMGTALCMRPSPSSGEAHCQYGRAEHLHYFCNCGYDWGVAVPVKPETIGKSQ